MLFTRKDEPSQADLEAGQYQKRRLVFQGMPIDIENEAGSVRRGRGWETRMLYPYGEIAGTTGVDGDAHDVYIGPNENALSAYIITQMCGKDFTQIDEQKTMLGFNSAEEAKDAYLKHYDNPRFFGSIQEMPVNEFRQKVMATKNKPALIKSIVFFKSHVQGYTKKDGTFVKPHEDKRVKKVQAKTNTRQLGLFDENDPPHMQPSALPPVARRELSGETGDLFAQPAPAPVPAPKAEEKKPVDPDNLKEKRQMYRDMIATKKANGEAVPQHYLDGIAEIDKLIGPEEKPAPVEKPAVDTSSWSEAAQKAYELRKEYHLRHMDLASDYMAARTFRNKIRRMARETPENDQRATFLLDALAMNMDMVDDTIGKMALEFMPVEFSRQRCRDLMQHKVPSYKDKNVMELATYLEGNSQSDSETFSPDVSRAVSVAAMSMNHIVDTGRLDSTLGLALRKVKGKAAIDFITDVAEQNRGGSMHDAIELIKDKAQIVLDKQKKKVAKSSSDKANDTLADISKKYWDVIPIQDIFNACRAQGLEPIQEDGMPWAGFLLGEEGRADIPLADSNKYLHISWYTMPSGRYEVTPYISSGTEKAPKVVKVKPVHQTETAAFKKWFGNSKILDENGKPKVMYHATPGDFSTFIPGGPEAARGEKTKSGHAVWFSPYADYQPAAHNIGRGALKNGVNVMPVYLKMERPLMIDNKEMLAWARQVFAEGSGEFPQIVLDKWVKNLTKDNEYDGIIFKGTELGWGDYSDEYIVFRPNQIKSASGNNGDFDSDNHDITKSFR